MRGAMRKATSPEVSVRPWLSCATSSSALSPGFTGERRAFQSQLGEDPVLSGERNGIGDGRDRHHFHERLQQPRFDRLPGFAAPSVPAPV